MIGRRLPAAWAVKYIPFWSRPPFLPPEQIFLPLGWLVPLKVKESEVAQSCLTLCDPMDCSLPGSSVHGIFQARVLEWVAISFSRGSSRLRDWTLVSCIAGRHFTIWATREVLKFHLSCALALTIMIDKESHLTNPGGTSGKEPNCQWGDIIDIGFIPGSGRAPGGGDGNPLQYPCLGNPLDRGACWAIVRGVANSWTRLKWLVCMQDSWNDCDWLTSQEALEIVGN